MPAPIKLKKWPPLPVLMLIASFLCPTEFSLFIDGLRIPPHRVVLIAVLPLALFRLLTQRNLKLRVFDALFIAFNAWTVGIFMYHMGDHDGLVYGGSLALESLGGYLIARVWVRDTETFRATLRAMAAAIAVAALFALPETLFGQLFTHDFLKSVTGFDYPTSLETRVHLTRAYGPFDHPIHYGTFCAAFLALFWFSQKQAFDRRKFAALLVFATLLGLSSAPILCLALQTALILWEYATRGVANRTSLTLVALAGLYIGAASVMTRSPIDFIATGFTLDSWTGYYRTQIWENGLLNVYANPWAGLGLNDWVRPWWMVSPTVDAFWLVIAMREGIPAVVLLVGAIALLMRAVVRRGLKPKDIEVRRISRGWIISVIALSLVGVTVHFWNVLHAYFFFVAGMGAWIADPKVLKARRTAAAAPNPLKTQVKAQTPVPALHLPGLQPA